ncbi:hypothetical protein [Streptomyces sp. NPDC001985]|uniref:hypothetical protein n=1 Tax=Streptomyces sp. NPDC001985 TaxID=3154406 RepID=UPI00332D0EDF
MIRGTTARNRSGLLAALLIALLLVLPAAAPAQALPAQPPAAAEAAGCAEGERLKEGTSPQRARDRHRAGEPGAGPPPRPAGGTVTPAALERSARAAAEALPRRARPPAGPGPAVLQVFRC